MKSPLSIVALALHSTCAAVLFLPFAGCATVRSTGSAPAGQELIGDTIVAATSRGAMPASTTASTTPASKQGSPPVLGDSPNTDTTLAPTSHLAPNTTSVEKTATVIETPTQREWPSGDEDSLLTTGAFGMPEDSPSWGEGTGKSYLIPAAEIVGFNFLLNQFNRNFLDGDEYDTDFSTFRDNLESGWIIDNDPFATNQFLHPYQGSMYHGFGRSAGLNYWESLGYDFGGSAVWETAGETGRPSLNDFITTPFGGSFLGEALFRMAHVLLGSGGERPGFYRELGAGLISPSLGFNRLAFGERFDARFPDQDPAPFTRVGLGARRNAKVTDPGVLSNVQKDQAVVDFAMDYGLPGKPGYEYERPFDYFQFEAAVTSSDNALPESVMTRGLLWGSKYQRGDSYRGVWGLYGSYDYMSPEVFSVSSTALSVGTTGQWWLSEAIALQGTLLGGAGWTAVGTIADAQEDRDYRYGVSPQGLLALRFIFGNVAMLDLAGRDYYVNGGGSEDPAGSENIIRGEASLTVRVYGHHALGLQFVATSRDEDLSNLSETFQTVGALSLFYTYLSDKKFGAVEWR